MESAIFNGYEPSLAVISTWCNLQVRCELTTFFYDSRVNGVVELSIGHFSLLLIGKDNAESGDVFASRSFGPGMPQFSLSDPIVTERAKTQRAN